MRTYEVKTKMGTFYVPADDYSVTTDGLRILFWTGTHITRSFKLSDLSTGSLDSVHIVETRTEKPL